MATDPIIFEILPPPTAWDDARIHKWIDDVSTLLQKQNILTVNIPEIIEEDRSDSAKQNHSSKLDNIHFAGLLKDRIPSLIIIPNKVCIRLSKQQFAEWVAHIYEKGIRHLVLVGGDHPNKSYPGYTVLEATQFVKGTYPDIKVGGVTIFTREGEADRILNKMKNGMDFFLTQIIYETANLKLVLLSLKKHCHAEHLKLPCIYFSLAGASKDSDIGFMKWLGVEFPAAVNAFITEDPEGTFESRSLQAVNIVLDEIDNFTKKEQIVCGFNIEHLMYNNLHLSKKLCNDVKRIFNLQ